MGCSGCSRRAKKRRKALNKKKKLKKKKIMDTKQIKIDRVPGIRYPGDPM